MARAAHWNGVEGYLQKANDEICLIVQAETKQAIDNFEEIVAIDGVHGVFIGPSDLSASMGYVGNPGHPEVVAAVEKGIEIIINAGKAAGVLAVDKTLAEGYAAKGANFVGVGVDVSILATSVRNLANQFCSIDKTSKIIAGY